MNNQHKITTINQDYSLEIYHLANLFFMFDSVQIDHEQIFENNSVTNKITLQTPFGKTVQEQTNLLGDWNSVVAKRMCKRFMKQCLYLALSKNTGKTMPWGCLTGVRPTQVAYELLNEGVDISVLKETLQTQFFLSAQKAQLLYETVKNQKGIIRNDHLVSLYINIPVCPSRCSYCSFISCDMQKAQPVLDDYLQALIQEIRQTKKMIFDRALVVRTIYIGGGTPSVLSASQLDTLLSELSYPVTEFTVECGRADTITEEKLLVLKKHGVSRICINPQTFTAKTLKQIGRLHTNEQVFNAYMLAVGHGFVVNMDFIAGLEGETLTNFKKTMNIAMELSPHNITIHTLFLKRKSELHDRTELLRHDEQCQKMVDYAYEILSKNGYKPYYLYRQKNQVGALENVGYARDGNICLFNIDTMEETTSVVACGAGAISKRIGGKDKQNQRYASPKTLEEYIKKLDEICQNKFQLFA